MSGKTSHDLSHVLSVNIQNVQESTDQYTVTNQSTMHEHENSKLGAIQESEVGTVRSSLDKRNNH